jgi:hypothetical protein
MNSRRLMALPAPGHHRVSKTITFLFRKIVSFVTFQRTALKPPADYPIFGSIATEIRCLRYVRFAPHNDQIADITPSRQRATNGPTASRKIAFYSISLSARATSDADTSTPIALAVFRLITSSNLVGCSTGISAGLMPRRILTTMRARSRNISVKRGP